MKQRSNSQKQLYYTNQLLKADSIINTDFALLSSKIHREYDTDTLLKEKIVWRGKKYQCYHTLPFYNYRFDYTVFLVVRFRKKEKELNARYQELSERFINYSEVTEPFNRSLSVSLTEKMNIALKRLKRSS